MGHIVLVGRMGVGKDMVAGLVSRRYGHVQLALADELKRFCATLFRAPRDLMWGPSHLRAVELDEPFTWDRVLDRSGGGDGRKMVLHSSNVKWIGRMFPESDPLIVVAALEKVIRTHEPITTVRRLLQLVGTEWGRAVDPLVWCRLALDVMRALGDGVPYLRCDGAMPWLHTRLNPASVVITDCRFPNEAEFFKRQVNASVVWIDADARIGPPSNPHANHTSEPTLEKMIPWVDFIFDNSSTMDAARSEVCCPWFEKIAGDAIDAAAEGYSRG